ncbi:hypothetical protein [uncultured Parasphingorhabdus sp.]|uniref:hypothetical protein n=1 Tax=uncultured Parasphingorhabdus sp. TaxID=2709694 RepID=UPI0030D7A131|tara:strand:- start:3471 stop:4007 length:537 start_codon:yes stop_codon:yes gene_type:complete
MLSAILLLVTAANPQAAMPTQGLLTIEGLDCISSQIPADRARGHYAMVRAGKETDAFESERILAEACQAEHGWSDIQARNAFRLSVMDGGALEEGLIDRIQNLGDFKPFLDQYYVDNVSETGRRMLEEVFQSGKMDKDLTAAGYPEHLEMREWVYNYFEWRGALRIIEDDFRNGELRQ